MTTTSRRTTWFATAAVTALVLGACGGGDDEESQIDSGGGESSPAPSVSASGDFPEGSTMAELSEAGSITIGTKFDQPGFGLADLEGTPQGFDVEVAKIVAGALGIGDDGIEYVETPSSVREQVLEDGDVDLVAATYTINDERRERVTFAGPYYVAGQQLMVRADDDRVSGPEDLSDPSLRVCSVQGSTPSENIREYLGSPDQLVLFDVYERCADALSTDQVDVVTTDNVILAGFVAESDGAFTLVGEQFTDEPYGIGLPKGDVEFCEFVNETLQANEEAYLAAWESTAGQIEGTETPELPEPDTCS